MSRNASSDLLVQSVRLFVCSIFRRAAGAASSLLAGALRFRRFAGVRLGGGLGRRFAGVVIFFLGA